VTEVRKHTTGHFLVAWGLPSSPTVFPSEVQKNILASLTGHAFVRIFETAVVVLETYPNERQDVIDTIVKICDKYENTDGNDSITFVTTPVSPLGKTYDGWLEEDIWDALNKRTLS
jgi:hypothetical protein